MNSIERNDEYVFDEKIRQLESRYPNVRVARDVPERNLHTVEVPFHISQPDNLLVDVLAAKTAHSIEHLLSHSLSGRIVLLVCTTAEGRISAVSTSVQIGSSRVTLQELYEYGILQQRDPTFQLVTVVSRVWRSIGCDESPKKQADGERRRPSGTTRQARTLPLPPTISRAEVESFLASGAMSARSLVLKLENGQSPTITEAEVMECFKTTATGMSWLTEAREVVRAMEETNEEKASRVDGLENHLAMLKALLRSRSETFREMSARREEVPRILAPAALKDQLADGASAARMRGQKLAEDWKEGRGVRDDVFVREYVDAIAAAYAMDAKRDGLELA